MAFMSSKSATESREVILCFSAYMHEDNFGVRLWSFLLQALSAFCHNLLCGCNIYHILKQFT